MTLCMKWTNRPVGRNTRAAVLLGVAIAIVGCSETDVVLPGKREPIGSVYQSAAGQALVTESAEAQNRTADISLPAATTNKAWTQGIGSPAYRVAHPALGKDLSLAWSARIGAGDGRRQRITADPVVAGGMIYTMDSAASVTATSASGATVWTADIKPPSERSGDATGGGLAYEDGTVYAATGFGRLAAIDAQSGAVKWTQSLEATGSGKPTVFGDLVYLLAGDETGWAINKNNGRIEWQVSGSTSQANVLGAPAPAVVGDLAVFAFGSGELQAVFRKGGLRRWDSSVLGERQGTALSTLDDVTGAPVASGGVIYAGNQAGRTVAIDAQSGLRLWSTSEGAIDPVLPVGGSVFMVSDKNELLRLNASDGSRVWGVKLPNFTKQRRVRRGPVYAHHGPILAGGRLVLASGDGVLRSFDPRNGNLISAVDMPSGATTAPVVAGGTLYVVGRKGQLFAFR